MQHGLRFDSSFELFVQSLDRIRGPHAAPWLSGSRVKANKRSPASSRLSERRDA